MSDEPRIWDVFKAELYGNGELIDEIDRTHVSLGHPKMVELSAYIKALQEIGSANARVESLTSENTRLRALLEEIPWRDINDLGVAMQNAEEDSIVFVVRRLLAIKEKIE